jgi:hypothetical protein
VPDTRAGLDSPARPDGKMADGLTNVCHDVSHSYATGTAT